jgi:ferredoxin-NADP reductase
MSSTRLLKRTFNAYLYCRLLVLILAFYRAFTATSFFCPVIIIHCNMQAVVEEHLPPPSPQTLILKCGPTPMTEALKKVLTSAGYPEDQQFQF